MNRFSTLVVLAITFIACGHENIDDIYTNYRLDIVTYMGKHDTDTHYFDYYGSGDELPIRLVYTGMIGEYKTGERVLLRYTIADPMPEGGGEVNLRQCVATTIISDTLRETSLDAGELAHDPIRLRSIWRTGNYINLHCEVEYTGKTRTLALNALQTTLDNDTVVCRLVHDMRDASAMQWRNCYASFYIGDIWNRTSCRTLKVVIDSDVIRPDKRDYCFDKH